MEKPIAKHDGSTVPPKGIDIRANKYLIIAVAAVLISIIYWTAFSVNALNTYHEYTDLGRAAYDMFYHVNYPSAVHGLQYLIFENHFMPDQLLVIPFYAIAQSPLTLLVIQAVVASLTGLVAFFIAKDLLNSPKIGLFICIAFLLNPGLHGMLSFDYHAEAAIPLFFLLAFYFMVKRRPVYFVISLVLLLGLIEVSTFVGMALGISMILYAVLRERDTGAKKSMIIYSIVAIVASLVMVVVYGALVGAISHAYVAGEYSTTPQFLKLSDIVGIEVSSIPTAFSSSGALAQYVRYSFLVFLLYALVLVFLGFGIAGLFDPLLTILLVSPWLAGAFLITFTNTIFIWNQYFGYAIGGGIAATILAIKSINDSAAGKSLLSLFRYKKSIAKYAVMSILVCSVIIFVLSPFFVYSKNINNLRQDYLFQISPAERAQVEQLTSILAIIPKNASVMAPFFTMSQLSARQYFEVIPSGPNNSTLQPTNTPTIMGDGMWFIPEYIVGDFNPYISMNAGSGYQIPNFVNITGATFVNGSAVFNGSYELYAYNGTAVLLKRR